MKNLRQGIPSHLVAVIALMIWTGLATGAGAYEARSNDARQVRVEVVPKQLQAGKEVKFEVTMNTHSVTLNHDLAKLSVLKDNQGREYRPSRWDGSSPGGHHRSGTLEFPSLAKGVKSVTLYIKDIADVPERAFEWKIE